MKGIRDFLVNFVKKNVLKKRLITISCLFLLFLLGAAFFTDAISAIFQDEQKPALVMDVQNEADYTDLPDLEVEAEIESDEDEESEEDDEEADVIEDEIEIEVVVNIDEDKDSEVNSSAQENQSAPATTTNDGNAQTTQGTQRNGNSQNNQRNQETLPPPAEPVVPEVIQNTVTISIRGTIEGSQIFTLNPVTVPFTEGETVFDVLSRVTRENRIQMDSVNSGPMGVYVRGINNLFEFDKGGGSGWLYRVNGIFPAFSSSRYVLSNGDVIEWLFTEDLGRDVGAPQG